MLKLQTKLEAILDDVNQEDGKTIQIFEKVTDSLFFLIKWGGIPMVLYLLVEVTRW